MQEFEIPIIYTMTGTYKIRAKSLAEALIIANNRPLPDGDFLEYKFDIPGIAERNGVEASEVRKAKMAFNKSLQ
jgi:hypothetical protein